MCAFVIWTLLYAGMQKYQNQHNHTIKKETCKTSTIYIYIYISNSLCHSAKEKALWEITYRVFYSTFTVGSYSCGYFSPSTFGPHSCKSSATPENKGTHGQLLLQICISSLSLVHCGCWATSAGVGCSRWWRVMPHWSWLNSALGAVDLFTPNLARLFSFPFLCCFCANTHH